MPRMGSVIRFFLIRAGFFARGIYELRFVVLLFSAIFTDGSLGAIAAEFTWWQWITNGFFLILDVYTSFVILRFLIRFLYQMWASNHLVHMRITLPKNDSKLDNERRTEKDFHEQIGKAEQFFRALHEVKDLNLYNMIVKYWFFGGPHISIEMQFENQELTFNIICQKYYQGIVEKQTTTYYESAEIEVLPSKKQFNLTPAGCTSNGSYLFAEKPFWYPIQVYKKLEDDAMNNVANAFAKLEKDEKAVVQFVINPASNGWKKKAEKEGTTMFKGKKRGWHVGGPLGILLLPFRIIWWPIRVIFSGYDPKTDSLDTNEPGASGGDHYVRMLQSKEEVAKSIGEKAIQSGFETSIRVLASSPRGMSRVQEILNGIFVSFNAFESKGGNDLENWRMFFVNFINAPLINFSFSHRLGWFFNRESLLCAEEMATLFHFPDARYNKIPTIKWLDYKVLPPPINLPKEGIWLGNSVYRGKEKKVQLMRDDRTRHMYIVGKSGTGKSVFLEWCAGQDINAGDGVGVIDPHGDLVEDVLSRVPKERAKEVIVFDPGDRERPMGLNILEAKTDAEKDRASLDAMEIFIKLFGNEIFGPRIQHYFRNGCLTLMSDEDEGATLIDIPRLFIDDDFQRYKVSKVRNPVVKAFWMNEIAKTGDREKQEMIPYFTSKFGPFVTNTTMRNVIGQTKSAFNIREVMDSGKVLLVNLSKGKIGSVNAQLLGLILVAKINQAAMGRVDIPKEKRRDFYLYVDEFQNFATDTFASILSEARKYRLNLIMAHQYIAQLSEAAGGVAIGQKDSKIRDAVFGNVGTMMNFKIGAEDAEYFEKEYAPLLSSQDILSISNYKAYLKLNINNTTSRVFSLETIWDPDGRNYKVADIIKQYSQMKYGRKKEFVDAEIEARMGIENLEAITQATESDPAAKQAAAAMAEPGASTPAPAIPNPVSVAPTATVPTTPVANTPAAPVGN